MAEQADELALAIAATNGQALGMESGVWERLVIAAAKAGDLAAELRNVVAELEGGTRRNGVGAERALREAVGET